MIRDTARHTDSGPVERKVLDLVGRALGRFSMLRPGDRVAVGVSGGKDSVAIINGVAGVGLASGRRRAWT